MCQWLKIIFVHNIMCTILSFSISCKYCWFIIRRKENMCKQKNDLFYNLPNSIIKEKEVIVILFCYTYNQSWIVTFLFSYVCVCVKGNFDARGRCPHPFENRSQCITIVRSLMEKDQKFWFWMLVFFLPRHRKWKRTCKSKLL